MVIRGLQEGKMKELEKKESKEGETSTPQALEVEAFLELLDREAQRYQLLGEKMGRGWRKPSANNLIAWQPTFKMEDFTTAGSFENKPWLHELREVEEGRGRGGLKRMRELSPPLFASKDKVRKAGDATRGIICDLNKSDESLDHTDHSSL